MIKHTARSAASGMRTAAASAASPNQSQEWSDAAQSMEEQRRKLSADYCRLLERHLRQAIDELEAVDVHSMNRDALGALARRQFTGDADTEPVSLRLQQLVLPLTAQRLAPFDSHMSAVLGLKVVRPEVNPFRPEIMCNVLADLMVNHIARPEELELWLPFLAPPYAGGLKRLYIDLMQLIQSQGVADARFQLDISVAPAASVGASAAPVPGASAAPLRADPQAAATAVPLLDPRARAVSDLQQQIELAETRQPAHAVAVEGRARKAFPTMQQLAQVLPGVSREAVHAFLHEPDWARNLDAPLPQSYFTALTQAALKFEEAAQHSAPPTAETLREFHARRRQQSPVDRAPVEFDLRQWLASEAWGSWRSPVERARRVLLLKSEATRISEVMAIDSTGLMLAQLVADTSLLWPVREAFLALTPALLQLAVQQPWYLANAEHPARRLIETIAQKSYEFNDEYNAIFPDFMEPVMTCVKHLQTLENADASALEQAFTRAGEQLQAGWNKADQPGGGPEGGIKAMQFEQNRQALATDIAAQLAELDAMGKAPEVVAKLMLETWSLVMAHAQLKDERQQRDPGGFRMAGMDLVWSLSAEAAGDPVRAFARLPPALVKLREGMEMIGASREEIEGTLSMLMPYHRRLLEMRRRKEGAPPDTGSDRLLPDTQDTIAMTLESVVQAGVVDTRPPEEDSGADVLGPATLPPDSTLDSEQLRAEAERMLHAMQRHDWFDMCTHGEWQRVQLVWCNENRSLFMFQGRTGSPHSMTRRICLKLLQQDLLRLVKPHAQSRKVTSGLDSGLSYPQGADSV